MTATAPTTSRRAPVRPPTLQTRLRRWYRSHRRDLPWRAPDRTPWGVLVSEVMLQQTPVARVEPVWAVWMARWPTPSDLAHEPAGAAVAAWGRLGYPRRALRLHAAAVACTERHDGAVPRTYPELRALPGVGDYTAAAVAAFAYGQRHVVLDTNIRRVLARLVDGHEFEPAGAPTRAERHRAEALLPARHATSAEWNVAVMELGATTCTARAPRCPACPVADLCAWRAAGHPPWSGPPRRAQPWQGTDRQARGALMALVRAAYATSPEAGVDAGALTQAWPETPQRERALAGLVRDGLLERAGRTYRLPTT